MGLFDKLKNKDKKTEKKPTSKKEGKARKKAEKILPFEEAEKDNQKIALYNEIVRHAYCYSTEPIQSDLSAAEKEIVFYCVTSDYPELFWVNGYSYSQNTLALTYRCLDKDGNLDVKEIERKKKELQKASNFFTRGITKKTKPYDAFITIYRRLILNLDYDGIGLSIEETTNGQNSYNDISKEDSLRSLYSALVERKVVCAGYAVALQYLLQKVGISCAKVGSLSNGSSAHAFVALKIGKYCYYADPTWDDSSNTKDSRGDNTIRYNYCCVPYREFIDTNPDMVAFHTPNNKIYPFWEKYDSVQHEYFRRRGAYFTNYDENKLINLITNEIIEHDEKEMGDFAISFRCPNALTCKMVATQVQQNLLNIKKKVFDKIKSQYRKYLPKAEKLLNKNCYLFNEERNVKYFLFKD